MAEPKPQWRGGGGALPAAALPLAAATGAHGS